MILLRFQSALSLPEIMHHAYEIFIKRRICSLSIQNNKNQRQLQYQIIQKMEDLVKIQYQAPEVEKHHQVISQQKIKQTLVKRQHSCGQKAKSKRSQVGRYAKKRMVLLEFGREKEASETAQAFQKLLNKYFITISEVDFEDFLKKIVRFKNTIIKSKIKREYVPAVFYYFYVDEIGIYNTKDFCHRNGINVKEFNREYKACVACFRKQKQPLIQDQSSSNLSNLQDRQQNETEKEDIIQKNLHFYSGTAIKKQQKVNENLSPLQAIDLVYDFVFKTRYFQDNRRQIILKMVEKYENTNEKLIAAIDWTDKQILKIYYIMIAYFRIYGAPFSFPAAKEIVYEKLKLSLTMGGYFATLRLFKKFEKEKQAVESALLKQKQELEAKSQ